MVSCCEIWAISLPSPLAHSTHLCLIPSTWSISGNGTTIQIMAEDSSLCYFSLLSFSAHHQFSCLPLEVSTYLHLWMITPATSTSCYPPHLVTWIALQLISLPPLTTPFNPFSTQLQSGIGKANQTIPFSCLLYCRLQIPDMPLSPCSLPLPFSSASSPSLPFSSPEYTFSAIDVL